MRLLARVLSAILVVILIYLILTFIRRQLGFGGKGDTSGKKSSTPERSVSQAESAVTTKEEPAVIEIKYADVTIREDRYVYNSGEYALDDLISQIKKLKGGEHIRIYDGGGFEDALIALKDALKENGIEYLDETGAENS